MRGAAPLGWAAPGLTRCDIHRISLYRTAPDAGALPPDSKENQHMDTGNNTAAENTGKPSTQHYASAKKAVTWLGHIIVAQAIAYFVRHWLP